MNELSEREMSRRIQDNEGLVRIVLSGNRRRVAAMRLEEEDVLQEMRIQLWYAIRYHDPNRAPFSAYAGMRMQQCIDRLIKKAKKRLENNVYVLPIDQDGGVCTGEDNYAYPPSTHGAFIDNQTVTDDKDSDGEIVFSSLKAICDERELRILAARMNGATLNEIGEQEGITRERVRQLYTRTMRRVRRAMEGQDGRAKTSTDDKHSTRNAAH